MRYSALAVAVVAIAAYAWWVSADQDGSPPAASAGNEPAAVETLPSARTSVPQPGAVAADDLQMLANDPLAYVRSVPADVGNDILNRAIPADQGRLFQALEVIALSPTAVDDQWRNYAVQHMRRWIELHGQGFERLRAIALNGEAAGSARSAAILGLAAVAAASANGDLQAATRRDLDALVATIDYQQTADLQPAFGLIRGLAILRHDPAIDWLLGIAADQTVASDLRIAAFDCLGAMNRLGLAARIEAAGKGLDPATSLGQAWQRSLAEAGNLQGSLRWSQRTVELQPALEESSVVAVFRFTNCSLTTCQITDVQAPAGVATRVMGSAPFPPDGGGAITVQYRYDDQSGPIDIPITVTVVAGGEQERHVLHLKVDRGTAPGVATQPLFWTAGDQTAKTIDCRGLLQAGHQIRSVAAEQSPWLEVRLQAEAGQVVVTPQWALLSAEQQGAQEVSAVVTIMTDHPLTRFQRIRIRCYLYPRS